MVSATPPLDDHSDAVDVVYTGLDKSESSLFAS